MKTNIKIVLKHTYLKNQERQEGNFWDVFHNAADQVRGEIIKRPTPEELIARVRGNFGNQLKKYLLEVSPSIRARIELATPIVFSVSDIKEGSLEIGLLVEPVNKVAEFFENNYSYFEAFLNHYIPQSLFVSLNPQSRESSIGWSTVVDQLSIEISPSPELLSGFSSAASSTEKTSSFVLGKANWLWILSNTSLVVPVIIGSVFLYLAGLSVQSRTTEIDNSYKKLYEIQNQLIDDLGKRLHDEMALKASSSVSSASSSVPSNVGSSTKP